MSERSEAVVVTGASTGIGADAATLLAREGYVTYAGVRTDADAARAAAFHERVRPVRLDVTDAGSIAQAVRAVRDGRLPLRAGLRDVNGTVAAFGRAVREVAGLGERFAPAARDAMHEARFGSDEHDLAVRPYDRTFAMPDAGCKLPNLACHRRGV